jgi:hypothetical protein
MKQKAIFIAVCALLCFFSLAQSQAVVLEDTTAPEITLVNPEIGYFHFSGIKLFQTRLDVVGDTMGFGGFRVRPVQAEIDDDVDPVENLTVTLYVDGEEERVMEYNAETEYFEGQWIGIGLGISTMNITAEDSSGNIASEEWDIWYFCFVPELS